MVVYTQVDYFLQGTGMDQGAGEDEGTWNDRAQLEQVLVGRARSLVMACGVVLNIGWVGS